MNKSVWLAIEKAVGTISQKNQKETKNNGPKKPDLFSLSGETELFPYESYNTAFRLLIIVMIFGL